MDKIKVSNWAKKEIVWELLHDRRKEYPKGGILKISPGSTSNFIVWESENSWGNYYDDGRMTIYIPDLDMHLELTF